MLSAFEYLHKMTFQIPIISFILFGLITGCSQNQKALQDDKTKRISVLIVDGQNNHAVWPKTTAMMKDYLESSGLFSVDVARTRLAWSGTVYPGERDPKEIDQLNGRYASDGVSWTEDPTIDPEFDPDFSKYQLIVSNFGFMAAAWPESTQQNLEKFMKAGGGLVVVHAANNSWPLWPAFNEMIGLGAWGDRDSTWGPYVYYDSLSMLQRNTAAGICGSHGPEYEFLIETRATEHPIMKGLPAKWLHARDELYDRMRGPAENMTVLATAYSDPVRNSPPWMEEVDGSGRHEPMLIAVEYGEGRIFHTTLGHMDYSMECVGFITTLLRGAEWAATGKVTQEIPVDFPTADQVKVRAYAD